MIDWRFKHIFVLEDIIQLMYFKDELNNIVWRMS